MNEEITIAQVREAKADAAKAIGDALLALWLQTGLEPRSVTFEKCGVFVGGLPVESTTRFEVCVTLRGP